VARPKVPLISPGLVVEAATAILEVEGLHALSLRHLGTRLRVNSASLYHHFASKEDILLAVARAALREITLPPLDADWEGWICENAVAYRRLLVRKPFLLSLIQSGIRPHTLAYAVADAKLVEAGVSDELRPEFLLALDSAVIGSALVSIHAAHLGGAPDTLRFDHEAMLRGTIRHLVAAMIEQAQTKSHKRRAGTRKPGAGG